MDTFHSYLIPCKYDPCHSMLILLQAIYRAFGGSQKGLYFKQLLTGLVAIVQGTKEEKAKCKKALYDVGMAPRKEDRKGYPPGSNFSLSTFTVVQILIVDVSHTPSEIAGVIFFPSKNLMHSEAVW